MSTTLRSVAAEMTAWRHDLHAHPEFGFELTRTAAFVADKLRSFGFDEVVEGVGRVGVVGTLRVPSVSSSVTETTAVSPGSSVRDTIVCSAVTLAQAVTSASFAWWGRAA